jgi:uncharacterized protein YndB with AHSA1/START domain
MAINIPINGRAAKTRSTFRMEIAVGANIRATPQRVWKALTDARDFPRWNSTVTQIQGNIALGEALQIKVPIAPNRIFKVKVSDFEPGRRMVWRDGAAPMFQGVRTYTLTAKPDGSTDYTMSEVFSGLMLPMIAGSLPDMAPVFETYAADLKREAERA